MSEPIIFMKPWQHAITDNIVPVEVWNPIRAQLQRTQFTVIGPRPHKDPWLGTRQTWQYHMDGYRTELPCDIHSLPINEILDINHIMKMWDEIRDPIFDLFGRLERDRHPFQSVMFEYHRVYNKGTVQNAISKWDKNRMNNFIMLEHDGIDKSTEIGFEIHTSPTNKKYTVNWSSNRMLSYSPVVGKTWIKHPEAKLSSCNYFNIALRS